MPHPVLPLGTSVLIHDHPPDGKPTWAAHYFEHGRIVEDRGILSEPWPMSAYEPYLPGEVRMYVVQLGNGRRYVFCDEEIEPLD
jgi:hypothetical protein